MSDNLRERERESKNEGWIYIVESKHNQKNIKIGLTGGSRGNRKDNPGIRLKEFETGGGVKIILVCKYNNIKDIETSLHIYFGDCFNTKVDGNEWFDFSKQKNQELLYRICPILLLSSISLYKNDDFDYSNEFWEKFTNWLQQHSNDNCKKYNSFLKNEKYKEYKKIVMLNYSKNEKQNKQKKYNKKQQQNTNKLCKYETTNKAGGLIKNWELFFDDHKKLIAKEVYCKFDKDKKYLAKTVELKTGGYGVIFNNEEMSFSSYALKLYKKLSNPNFSYSLQGTAYVYFVETGKNILETYNELKNNFK